MKNIHVTTGKITTKRVEGDEWEEGGKLWTIKNGIKRTVTKMDQARKEFLTPLACPECGSPMKHHLDEKMWNIHKMCFDCVIDMEHQLRIEGKYNDYEKQKVKENALAWLRDAEKDVEDLVNAYKYASFVNQDGSVENWAGGLSPEEFENKVRGEFEKFKIDFVDKLG